MVDVVAACIKWLAPPLGPFREVCGDVLPALTILTVCFGLFSWLKVQTMWLMREEEEEKKLAGGEKPLAFQWCNGPELRGQLNGEQEHCTGRDSRLCQRQWGSERKAHAGRELPLALARLPRFVIGRHVPRLGAL